MSLGNLSAISVLIPPSYDEILDAAPNEFKISKRDTNYIETPPPCYNDAFTTFILPNNSRNGELENSANTTRIPHSIGLDSLTTNTESTATLLPHKRFNVKKDVKLIKIALETKDEDLLVQILTHRSTKQRQDIAYSYYVGNNIPLSRDIKNHIRSVRSSLLLAGLAMPLHECIAKMIYDTDHFSFLLSFFFILSNESRMKCLSFYESGKIINSLHFVSIIIGIIFQNMADQ